MLTFSVGKSYNKNLLKYFCFFTFYTFKITIIIEAVVNTSRIFRNIKIIISILLSNCTFSNSNVLDHSEPILHSCRLNILFYTFAYLIVLPTGWGERSELVDTHHLAHVLEPGVRRNLQHSHVNQSINQPINHSKGLIYILDKNPLFAQRILLCFGRFLSINKNK